MDGKPCSKNESKIFKKYVNQFLRARIYRGLRGRRELFYKPIIVSKDDIDKLKKQEMKRNQK